MKTKTKPKPKTKIRKVIDYGEPFNGQLLPNDYQLDN